MSELTIKLIIILIPGAIATLIFGKLILHKEWSSFKFTLYSILFGVVSYLVLQIIVDVINLLPCIEISQLTVWENLTSSSHIPYWEVFFASILSLILSFVISLIENKKMVNRIAIKLGISNKYGEENLYSRFLNSPNIEYVYLRDIKNNLTYLGWVKSFSETDNISEITLGEVSVYEYESSNLLYSVDEVYLSFNKQEIIIETALIDNSDKVKSNG